MLAVETCDLTKDYLTGFWRKRPRRALSRLNLKVEASETFGLLGPNGAGKSTTLKLLFRLIFPTSGTARILGRDLSDLSVHARLGYLPENPSFYDHLSAPEFLAFTGELFGLARSTARRRAAALLERVGLEAAPRLPLRKFSKGMVQRLGIAQALMNDPELIFLDEPMSGLDPIGRREVRNLILDLRREGKTIFFSTHILSDAETLCDHVAILHRGELLGSGDLREILRLEVSATEVMLADPPAEALRALEPLARSIVRTGSQVRLEFGGEHDPESVLKAAMASGAKVIAFNPVKASLEDYFMVQVGAKPEGGAPPGRAAEVSGEISSACHSEEFRMSLATPAKHENDPSPALLRRAPSPEGRGLSTQGDCGPLPSGEGGERSEPGEG